MMVHFNHPDEFLKKMPDGSYIENPAGGLEWIAETRAAVKELAWRSWINIDNQSPLIKGINDDPHTTRTEV